MDYQDQMNKTAFASNAQVAPEHQNMQLFRKYCAIQQEFNDACHNLAQAQQRRSIAEQQLNDITRNVAEVLQNSQNDPTVPSPVSNGSAAIYCAPKTETN